MIKNVFIGKPLHWIVLALLMIPGYFAGIAVFHTTNFVPWVSILFGLTFLLIILFWLTSNKEDSLTRDPIIDEDEVKLREYVD
jgi:uncharacterized membrane protein YfhO